MLLLQHGYCFCYWWQLHLTLRDVKGSSIPLCCTSYSSQHSLPPDPLLLHRCCQAATAMIKPAVQQAAAAAAEVAVALPARLCCCPDCCCPSSCSQPPHQRPRTSHTGMPQHRQGILCSLQLLESCLNLPATHDPQSQPLLLSLLQHSIYSLGMPDPSDNRLPRCHALQ